MLARDGHVFSIFGQLHRDGGMGLCLLYIVRRVCKEVFIYIQLPLYLLASSSPMESVIDGF